MDLSTVSLKSATALSETLQTNILRVHCTWVQKFSRIWRNGDLRGEDGLGGGGGGSRYWSCSSHSHHLQKLRYVQPCRPSGPGSFLKLHLPRIRFPASEGSFLSFGLCTAVT